MSLSLSLSLSHSLALPHLGLNSKNIKRLQRILKNNSSISSYYREEIETQE
jgi:hypothetical protein